MHRWARALSSALVLLALLAGAALAAGPPFPDPQTDRAVYDEAGVLRAEVVAEVESRIDAIEAAVGAEIVVYTQVDPGISEDENLAKARALMDQWGIGREGFDDGLVLMVGLNEDRVHGKVSLYGGSGFLAQHIDEDGLQSIVDDRFVPRAADGDLNSATLDTIDAIQGRMAPDTVPLTVARVVNAALGIIVAPLALIAILGLAWWKWRREGDDPELIDSPSILMAGPPAEMTPPLATVVRNGTANQHSINTVLAELASTGRLTFQNLDRVREVKSDDEPDPLTDPAITVNMEHGDDDDLAAPERQAWSSLRSLAGGSDTLRRERLWRVNSALDDVKETLESEAVRLGWLARMPGSEITRMTVIGVALAIVGGIAIFIGVSIPMSGAVLVGAALVLGGAGTVGFGRAMSQRTPAGAYVDAMLSAYRRTLRKTMEMAHSMDEVVNEPDIARLANTPDKAVVWGLALGLHDEVASLLARGLANQRDTTGSPVGAYYPIWLGSTPGSAWSASAGDAAGGVSYGSGSIFSGSAMPDIGGMFSALGSVGSSPPSSSSGGGGGFGGGGGGGGGGGSGSF
ncbi:MAG TPA: TPM domain-containing protein [Candidatus Limnocylindria bacterium]